MRTFLGIVIGLVGFIMVIGYFAPADNTSPRHTALDKQKGFHCLSSWDGSHRDLKNTIEKASRNPDSFEHIETKITPVNERGEHRVFMSYRGENGFGGMARGMVSAVVDTKTCAVTNVTVE